MRSPRSQTVSSISPAMEAILRRVEDLSDLELRKELSARQFSCGPIVGTTRSVYKKKLVDMLVIEECPASARTAASSEEEEEEDDEEEEVVPVAHMNGNVRSTRSTAKPRVMQEEPVVPADDDDDEDDVVVEDDDEEEEEEEIEEASPKATPESSQEEEEEEEESSQDEGQPEIVARQEDRDALRHRFPAESVETKTTYVSEDGKTVRRTTTTTTRYVKSSSLLESDISRSTPEPVKDEPVKDEPQKKKSSCLSLIFQLLVMIIMAVLIYIVVVGPSSPLALPAPHDVENPPVKDAEDV